MNDHQARTIVIINRKAARARAVWPRIADALARERIMFDSTEASERNETENLTRCALHEGYNIIAIVGGDGTLSEAVRGFFEPPPMSASEPPSAINPAATLAMLPAGTGDDFARGLVGRRASLDEWLSRFTKHYHHPGEGEIETRAVDVLWARVSDSLTVGGVRAFVCLNAATLGIGAEVAARVAAQTEFTRRAPGEARFALAAFRALKHWRERRVSIHIDDAAPFECETNLIAIANGAYAGGGMNFSPEAKTNDGQLDVVTACGISRRELLRELLRIHRGGHLANPKVRVMHGSRVRINTVKAADAMPIEADGDVRGHTPLEFGVMPAALRVVL